VGFYIYHFMMKILLFTLLIGTGTVAQENLLNFKGTITNTTADSVVVTSKSGKWHRAMAIDAKGYFAGKIQQGANTFTLSVGDKKTKIWLENESDLTITADAKNFIQTLRFEGVGAKENNFMLKMERDKSRLIDKYKLDLNAESLEKEVSVMVDNWTAVIKSKELSEMFNRIMAFKIGYIDKESLTAEISNQIAKSRLGNGASPGFSFINYKGGVTTLKDFKGKYVYIDIWATWCGPCRQEIPFLQKIEQTYKDKNIAFISISIDKAKDIDKWRAMVNEQTLGGVQLFADKDWKSDFIEDYGINSIPHFILIDPKGNIVDADATRPSDTALQVQLNKLLK
jgi:thiol-disulfide isomerase/thioredoxin